MSLETNRPESYYV